MNTTIVLGQILGIVLTVLGFGMLFNRKGMMAVMRELTESKVFMWLGGLIALVIGAVIVALDDSWTSGLPLLVTVIGWLALLKGVLLVVFPSSAGSFYRKMNKNGVFVVGGLIVLLLGLIMLF